MAFPTGRAGLSRPEKRGLALIGESDGCEIGRRRVDLSKGLPDHQVNVPPDLVGIVLDPTRLRIDLLVLSLGHGHESGRGDRRERIVKRSSPGQSQQRRNPSAHLSVVQFTRRLSRGVSPVDCEHLYHPEAPNDCVVDRGALDLSEPIEHVVCGVDPIGRATDSDLQTPELVRPQRVDDRPDAVVTTGSPTELHFELRKREIDVVVNDEEPIAIDVLVPNQGCDRLTALVHERAGQCKDGACLADSQGGDVRPDAEACTLERELR